MKIKDFINQCQQHARKSRKLSKKKVSFDFLFSDDTIRENISSENGRIITINFSSYKKVVLNYNDNFINDMIVLVYPYAPFFEVYYFNTIELINRKRSNINFEELEIYFISEDDSFNIFTVEKEYITDVLKKHGYKQLSKKRMYTRIPLLDIDNKISSKYILGGQPYLCRLLEYGIEYRNRFRRHLDLDIDKSLIDIGDELIYLVKKSQYINGEFIVNSGINKYSYKDAKILLDAMCLDHGGEGFMSKDNYYIWHIGNEYLDEGDVKIFSSVYVYLSAYIKTFYVKVHLETFVNNKNLPHFCVKSSIFGEDAQILLGNTTNMFYDSIEGLEALGYKRQEELNYKLPVQVAGSSESKELEIGEILFGLKPDEYSYIQKVEKL